MRRFGRERRECYVWWGGYTPMPRVGQVVSALVPDIATEFGRVILTRQELGRLQSELHANDQVLLLELHSHPPMAGGQNSVDAAHPASPHAGFISVVVPDFGLTEVRDLSECHVYEYEIANHWRELTSSEIRARFTIEPVSRTVDCR